jgi:hypothetical protein
MDIYDKYGILTSQEMQTNFYTAISKRKGQEQESYDYWLLGELKFARPNFQKELMQFLRTYCYNLWHFCAIFVQSCDQNRTCVFLVFVL